MIGRTGVGKGQSAPAGPGWPAVGTVAAYAAAIVAFGYALMSLYWALGGHALISTIGGYVEELAGRGGALPVLATLAATLEAPGFGGDSILPKPSGLGWAVSHGTCRLTEPRA